MRAVNLMRLAQQTRTRNIQTIGRCGGLNFSRFHTSIQTYHDASSIQQKQSVDNKTSSVNSTKTRSHESVFDKISPKTTVRFTVSDSAGSLSSALHWFHVYGISMSRLESRPSKRSNDYDFYVDFTASDSQVSQLVAALKQHVSRDVHVLEGRKVAWFPRRAKDLDLVANEILDAGDDLQSDHPGFHDAEYRARRAMIAQRALSYKIGESIPAIEYTANEKATWTAIWDKLMPLIDSHACNEYARLLPLLMENCGYSRTNIPQIGDISDFLKDCTGFTIRPVAGLLSARNFLYGLAFRVFFSTQYLRHHSRPLYTPEPDLVHELMGHAPLFADRSFADFSQAIGLAAIGATDEQITALSRCYWFTVEFGLCLQNGERKAYGAGLLSSFGELEYSMSDKPKIRPFDPFHAAQQNYPITEYQPIYYQASSFEDAKQKMTEFSESFARPFNVRYNPYSQSIEVDSNIRVNSLNGDDGSDS